MAEVFKFQKKDKAYYNVEVDGVLITLPISNSMPVDAFTQISKITNLAVGLTDGADAISLISNSAVFCEALRDLFKIVLPSDKYEEIGIAGWAAEDLVALYSAWQNSAKLLQGASLGESQASASS